jgi:hypothetical protein
VVLHQEQPLVETTRIDFDTESGRKQTESLGQLELVLLVTISQN